jgi:hypothetical protein
VFGDVLGFEVVPAAVEESFSSCKYLIIKGSTLLGRQSFKTRCKDDK